MRITNLQKKELNEIFRRYPLNLLDFEVTGQYKEFKLKFKYDYFSFSINKTKADEYTVKVYSVGNTSPIGSISIWQGVLNNFEKWTKILPDELNIITG